MSENRSKEKGSEKSVNDFRDLQCACEEQSLKEARNVEVIVDGDDKSNGPEGDLGASHSSLKGWKHEGGLS